MWDWVKHTKQLTHSDRLGVDDPIYYFLILFIMTLGIQQGHSLTQCLQNHCLTAKWLTNQHETERQLHVTNDKQELLLTL